MKYQIVVLCFAVLAMHALVTLVQGSGNATPEQIKAKQDEIDRAISQLAGNCGKAVQTQRDSVNTLEDACRKVEEFEKSYRTFDCTYEDYQDLHGVVCYFNGKYVLSK